MELGDCVLVIGGLDDKSTLHTNNQQGSCSCIKNWRTT